MCQPDIYQQVGTICVTAAVETAGGTVQSGGGLISIRQQILSGFTVQLLSADLRPARQHSTSTRYSIIFRSTTVQNKYVYRITQDRKQKGYGIGWLHFWCVGVGRDQPESPRLLRFFCVPLKTLFHIAQARDATPAVTVSCRAEQTGRHSRGFCLQGRNFTSCRGPQIVNSSLPVTPGLQNRPQSVPGRHNHLGENEISPLSNRG